MVQPTQGSSLLDALAEVLDAWPERPSWDEYFMATAMLIASRSACGRLHVGCVLVSGGEHPHRIVAAGYNGFLPGAAHESVVRDGHEQGTVHAEQNAIADAARRGVSVAAATAYISHYPCLNCAKILAASGIAAVRYHFDYDNDPLVADLCSEAGIEIARF
jgi:dCMP deaminase